MIAYRVAIVAIVATIVAASAECNIIDDVSRTVGESINALDLAFSKTISLLDNYSYKSVQFKSLAKSGRELEGKELFNTAQLSAYIEVAKYAIRRESLSKIKKVISERYVDQGYLLWDRKLEVNMNPEILGAIVSRIIMRGYADCERFTATYWGWLHLLIEHNLSTYTGNKAFELLAKSSYEQLVKLRADSERASRDFERILEEALEKMHIDQLQSKHIVDRIDAIIEDSLGCKTCASKLRNPDYYNTRPMFDNSAAIEKAVMEHVSKEIQDAFVEIDGVFDVTREEQARVTRQDVDSLMQKVLHEL